MKLLRCWAQARGHSIHTDANGDWVYTDTGEKYDFQKGRECTKCGLPPTEKGHDPCIANLPNVKYACCGHGNTEPYVQFNDDRTLRGEEALAWMEQQ